MNIKEDFDKYILKTYNRFDLCFVSGKGVYLYSDTGKEYLDFASGIAVSSLGHSNKAMVDAINKQAKQLIHTSNLYYNLPQLELAKKLVEKSVFQKVFFCNSGAEANEGAIKLARKFGKANGGEKKYQIITMKNSFHGRTITTLSATGQTKYQKGFEPMTEGFTYVELNNIKELREKFNENVCAVIIEPVQGEGGINPATNNFIKETRALCDKYNALLIYDEIQTGIGRTGKLFGYEHFLPVEPDIVTLAKGLGGGLPIGAFLLKEKLKSFLTPGEHASTFGGNLLTTTAAKVVLEQIEKKKLLSKVKRNGDYFKRSIKKLKTTHKSIIDVRGLGYLLGIQIDFPARDMINSLISKNIVAIPAGENVVRLMPPLIAEKKHFDIVINAIDQILTEREKNEK
ncbi:MAG TPA: aspartate aminotransferase family protein [Spirochaetota bacterium]|nr:aspartate aminotransferase family protein [Spirochaetota bacterium]